MIATTADLRGIWRGLETEGLAHPQTASRPEAKALDRMKSDFIATVSHEVRTPMTSIMGFAKISRRKLAGTVAKGMAPEATEARRALDQVTSNLDLIMRGRAPRGVDR